MASRQPERDQKHMRLQVYAAQQSAFGTCVAAYDSSFASGERRAKHKNLHVYTIRDRAPELRLLQRPDS